MGENKRTKNINKNNKCSEWEGYGLATGWKQWRFLISMVRLAVIEVKTTRLLKKD